MRCRCSTRCSRSAAAARIEAEVRTLLGTLDRKHVQGILTALAEKDGAALMQQAAHLDERAPDYHQALGELSGAIQRMALLQALPDLPPGDDEDEDKLLAELAAKFSPEDLQLLYQIAINSRRDLDYAPDARAGFEMALLRMLAFRPQGSCRRAAATPAPAAGARRWREASVRPREAQRRRARTAPATAPDARPNVRRRSLPTGTASSPRSACRARRRHFAANCVMLERKAGVVRLRLDPAGETFRRPQIETRLAEALSQHFGEPIRLEITQAEAPGEILTPARRDAIAAEDRQRAAEAVDRQRSGRARDARGVRRDGSARFGEAAQLSAASLVTDHPHFRETHMMKGGIGNMMKQAQALQANMQKAQAEIAAMEVVGESGGGMVKITMNGKHEAKRVQIDPSRAARRSRDDRRPGGGGDQRRRAAHRSRDAAAHVERHGRHEPAAGFQAAVLSGAPQLRSCSTRLHSAG